MFAAERGEGKTRPEIPENGVVAAGHHDPPLLLAALGDPGELALGEVGALHDAGVLGFEPEQAGGRGSLPHAASESICLLLVLVLQISARASAAREYNQPVQEASEEQRNGLAVYGSRRSQNDMEEDHVLSLP